MASSNVKSIEDFMELSSGELKYFLQQRGLPSSSGTHGSLAARALIAYEQNVSIVVTADHIAAVLKDDYRAIYGY